MKKLSLLKSSSVVGLMTLVSRVLGLIRDIVIATFFGAQGATDAYFVAQKIPNFLRRLFAEGAFAQAFVPVLAEYKADGDQQKVKSYINKVAGTLGGILTLVTILAVLGAGIVIAVFSPGFYLEGGEKYVLATDMLRITFPYLFFIGLTAFCGAILNSYNQFAVPAITPVFLNLCLIAAAMLFAPQFDVPAMALAWGIFVAGIIQLGFQLPFLWRLNLLPKPAWGFNDPGVKKTMNLMIPALFGVSVSQINLLLDTQIASFLETGSITWLYMSDRLLEFPLGIFGIAIATVILPVLSSKHAEKSPEAFNATLDWGVKVVVLVGVPAAAGLVILAEPLMLTLFQYKNFSLAAAYQSSLSLQAYALGLLPFMLIKVLAPGFFARQNTKTPVKVGIVAMVSNMGFNLLLFIPFKHVGLAMATTLSAILNASLLFYYLKKEGVYRPVSGWLIWCSKITIALVVMVAAVSWLAPTIEWWRENGVIDRVTYLSFLIAVAISLYLLAIRLLGVRLKSLTQQV
ncbi:MAG: murein biosynthesis integral membrane protein MurJ [Pseudomonadota bacterium]